jgi:hypothetical protein
MISSAQSGSSHQHKVGVCIAAETFFRRFRRFDEFHTLAPSLHAFLASAARGSVRDSAILMTGNSPGRAAGRLNLSNGIEKHQQVGEVAMVGLDDRSVNGGADLGNARML